MSDSAPPTGFSRRKLLKSGALGLALVAASSVGLALQRTRIRPLPAAGLKVLTAEQYSIFAAIAERFCPPAAPGVAVIDTALLADRFLERAEEDVRDGVRLALGIVESGLTGALTGERARPFTHLAPEAQARALEWFRISRLPVRRMIYRSFSGLVGSLHYGDPRAWPAIGYPGPPDPAALRSAYAAQLVDLEALRGKPEGSG